jgi:hypothetical protein
MTSSCSAVSSGCARSRFDSGVVEDLSRHDAVAAIRIGGRRAPRVYEAGQAFFEPAGSEHLISENAGATEPSTLLAVFVADDGAALTTDDP